MQLETKRCKVTDVRGVLMDCSTYANWLGWLFATSYYTGLVHSNRYMCVYVYFRLL